MKSLANKITTIAICLLATILAGCARQTSHLQNQYGARAAATEAKADIFDNIWLSAKIVHPSFAVSTNNNVGSQLVNPAEQASPRSLGPVNPMAAVGAVDRYQKGQVRALPEVSVDVGGGSGSGSSSN
jgi:type IV pilus biogenesis protein CpaD/CtpE